MPASVLQSSQILVLQRHLLTGRLPSTQPLCDTDDFAVARVSLAANSDFAGLLGVSVAAVLEHASQVRERLEGDPLTLTCWLHLLVLEDPSMRVRNQNCIESGRKRWVHV